MYYHRLIIPQVHNRWYSEKQTRSASPVMVPVELVPIRYHRRFPSPPCPIHFSHFWPSLRIFAFESRGTGARLNGLLYENIGYLSYIQATPTL